MRYYRFLILITTILLLKFKLSRIFLNFVSIWIPEAAKSPLQLLQGGDLFDKILKAKRFSEIQAATVTEQMCRLFAHMWTRDIVHRDVKPENFMFLEKHVPIEKATLKMIDFGFARPAEDG